ncbi:TPA: phage antirepressor KilAC domain-containing protein [Escherichia coli]|nr:phage antirepressor KilAC domain-containing protein [Escherichia coli]
MLLNWQGRHFMEINHSRITSYEIADYMIRTKSLLSAKELAAILEKEYPHLDVDKRDVYLRLRENGILIASGGRKNVPFQQYINAGYFTVKEVVLDDEDGYQIRLTPQLTGKGQQWLTRKLLDAGLLKPVAAE